METGVISRKRMEANMMSRLLPAGHQYAVYGRQRIPMIRVVAADEIRCGMTLCGSSVGTSVLTNDVLRVRNGLVGRHFSRRQSNREHL
jgi:ribose 5-phosphate isomerase RpiB